MLRHRPGSESFLLHQRSIAIMGRRGLVVCATLVSSCRSAMSRRRPGCIVAIFIYVINVHRLVFVPAFVVVVVVVVILLLSGSRRCDIAGGH